MGGQYFSNAKQDPVSTNKSEENGVISGNIKVKNNFLMRNLTEKMNSKSQKLNSNGEGNLHLLSEAVIKTKSHLRGNRSISAYSL